MARFAAYTDKGPVRETNEDACCVEVAQTAFGEVAMAIVCDGVGGLAAGELASSTVAVGFCDWFERDLPTLLEGTTGEPDLCGIRASWDHLLARLNALIRSYGISVGEALGTTFTGVVTCQGAYLLGHVGDCRAYLMGPRGIRRLSEDQTPPREMGGERGYVAGDAPPRGANAILQAVGTQAKLEPVFSTGDLTEGDLLVICSDGAWRRAGDDGVCQVFEGVDHGDEGALEDACRLLVELDLAKGERDNLTVVCLAPEPWGHDGDAPTEVVPYADESPTEPCGGAS